AQIETGGAAGRSQELAFVDVEHIGQQLHAREALGEEPRETPVGGRAQAIEEPGRGEHERARADRYQPRPLRVRAPERGQDRARDRLSEVVPPAGDHHGARAFERAQAMPCPDCYAPLGAQRARLRGADPEVVPGHAQLPPTPCGTSAACSSSKLTAGTSMPRSRRAGSSCSTSAARSSSDAATYRVPSTCRTRGSRRGRSRNTRRRRSSSSTAPDLTAMVP